MSELNIYMMSDKTLLPLYSTRESACFDLRCCFHKDTLVYYGSDNAKRELEVKNGKVLLPAGSRTLVPTGLIFDIPEGYSVRIHPRSGTSLKFGLTLINSEGIIDSDYTDEVMIPIHNASSTLVEIADGERYAQAELVKCGDRPIFMITTQPPRKGDRTGGFGSTGVS